MIEPLKEDNEMAIKLAKGKNKKTILKAFGNPKVSRKDLNKANARSMTGDNHIYRATY